MGQISKETVEHVLQATDIVELIQGYIPVKRAGSAYKANCPFHNEKTPSFTITPARQRFHCFGCGKGGDAISFVRDYENLPFSDAVKKLAARAGIPILEDAFDPAEDARRKSRGRLLDLQREAAEFFHAELMRNPAAEHARAYIKSRGFGAEMAKRWTIGWMPRDTRAFLAWARERKFSGRELEASGLAGLREENNPQAGLYVRFSDRLMFPVRNEIGDVIAFSGRKLREDQQGGKYQNSPATAVFNKSRVLFALDRAKRPILQEKYVLLCEGQLDVISCHEAGFEHAVAPLGTAFTPEHAKLLKRFTNQIVICYDADGAGIAASKRAFKELAAEGISVRVATMPPGDDPDTFLKSRGPEDFRRLLDEAPGFFDYEMDRARGEGRLDDAAGKSETLASSVEMLALMEDYAARESQINIVAMRLQVSATQLRTEVAKFRKRLSQRPAARTVASAPEQDASEIRPLALHRIVAYLCQLALESSAAQHFLAEQFETLHEAGAWLEGIPLLEKILAGAPDARSGAAVNGFLATLEESEQLALAGSHQGFSDAAAENETLHAAEQALALLSSTVLQKRDAAVKAALKMPGVAPEQMLALLEEAKEIRLLMRGVRQRSEFDDELPPSTWRPKEPEWKRKFR